MKRIITYTFFSVFFIFILILKGHALYKATVIDEIRLDTKDIPQGFVLGQIPGYAKKTFKQNPWLLDKGAIKTLTQEIYPGGDFHTISSIHMTIFANEQKPYNDDIVCYIIVFNDLKNTKTEIQKINKFVGYNSDRALVVNKDNIAVFLHVDDVTNFHYINDLASSIKERLNTSK